MTIDNPREPDPQINLCRLPAEAARRVDEICDAFETQLFTEGRPQIEEFLGGFKEPERSVLLRELLLLELDAYLSADAFPDLEKYCQRFPGRRDLVKDVFEKVLPTRQPGPAESRASRPNIPNYHVLEQLGEGGMGTVYKAIHTKLQSFAAIKVLRVDRVKDVEAAVRFQREMKVVGNLSHPNIVEARDAGVSEGTHYLIMEYVDGLDLGSVLCRFGPLPVSDACEIARRVAVALQHAHEHNLVHRDIKPSNLLLGHPPQNPEEVQVKVADLGLARLRGNVLGDEHAAQYGRVMGTFRYMAPEQYWAPETVDIRSDIYSLGCTLYALLLGRPPFSHPQYDDPRQVMLAHRDQPVAKFRRLRPDVSEAMEEAVLWMMAKNPDDRFQTPAELAKSLAFFSGGHDLPGLLARAESLPLGPITRAPTTGDGVPAGSGGPAPSEGGLATTQTYRRSDDHGVRSEDFVLEQHRDESGKHESPPSSVGTRRKKSEAKVWRALPRPAALWWVVVGATTIAFMILLGVWLTPSGPPVPIDLLMLAEPDRDGLGGPWKRDGRTLISPDVRRAVLELPYRPPPQYRLEIDAMRVSGGKWAIGLLWRGRQIPVVINEVVVRAIGSPTARRERISWSELPEELRLTGGRPHTYTCIVRECGFSVAYEDELLVSQVAGKKALPVEADWQPANRNVLFLGSSNSIYRFRKITLTPIRP